MDGCQHSDIVEDPEKADKMARFGSNCWKTKTYYDSDGFGVHGDSRAGFADIDA